MNNPLISIISPIYKAESYLDRLINSALNQTYPHFELILVDDGSPDRSGEICDAFAAKDSRIKVIHKENGGVSSARNAGIEIATGEWCCFVDSDDWVEACYLRNFVNCIEDDVDHVLQGFNIHNTLESNIKTCKLICKTFNNACELVVFLKNAPLVHNGFLWHRIFRRNIIEKYNIRFIEGLSFAEDGCFCFEYLKYSRKAILTNQIGYNYVAGNEGLTKAGKKLSYPIYYKLIETFSQLVFDLIKINVPAKKVSQEMAIFIWRLVEDWGVIRSCENFKDYLRLKKFIIELYHQNKIPSPPNYNIVSYSLLNINGALGYYICQLVVFCKSLSNRVKYIVKRLFHDNKK